MAFVTRENVLLTSGSRVPPSVDPDDLARDVARLVADEERAGGGDVLGAPDPAHGRALLVRLHAVAEQAADFRSIGVSMNPGGIVFTVMPFGPNSSASALVRPITPAFDAT